MSAYDRCKELIHQDMDFCTVYIFTTNAIKAPEPGEVCWYHYNTVIVCKQGSPPHPPSKVGERKIELSRDLIAHKYLMKPTSWQRGAACVYSIATATDEFQ